MRVLQDTTGWTTIRSHNRRSKYESLFEDTFDSMAEKLVNCSTEVSADVILTSTKKLPASKTTMSSLYKAASKRYRERYPDHNIQISFGYSEQGDEKGYRTRLVNKPKK